MSAIRGSILILCLLVIASGASYYFTENLLLTSTVILFIFAIAFTIVRVFNIKKFQEIDIKRIWKEVLNALSGLT